MPLGPFVPEPIRTKKHSLIRPAGGVITSTLRPALHLAREGLAHADLVYRSVGQGPLAVFLPAGPCEGSALLRIYNMASALRLQGWRIAVLPWKLSLSQRRRYLAVANPDVVVMQGARHALNRPALYPQWPVLYDMDDADFHLDHLRGPVSEAMGQVTGVIAGSRYIADWALAQGARRADVIWTGTPVSDRPRPSQVRRPPVVAWAQTRPMTYTREADLVAKVMGLVARRRSGTVLRLYDWRPGDDPSFADRFRALGLGVDWRPAQPYGAFLASFDDVAVGLAPLCPATPFSRGKSFGKVLAYLDRQVPVVASAACEHPEFFTARTGVMSDDPGIWADEIINLLDNATARQQMADAAFAAFSARLSREAAASRVLAVLSDVMDPQASGPAGRRAA